VTGGVGVIGVVILLGDAAAGLPADVIYKSIYYASYRQVSGQQSPLRQLVAYPCFMSKVLRFLLIRNLDKG
jgi:hypothetical protein